MEMQHWFQGLLVTKLAFFDYKYRHAGGDFEYGIRANKNGFNCYAIPTIGRCDRKW